MRETEVAMVMEKINSTPSMNTILLQTLRDRFEQNMHRHPEMEWDKIMTKLISSPHTAALEQMELTGGEPDVV